MMNRYSLDRFKKAQSAEPFSVNPGAVASIGTAQARPSLLPINQVQAHPHRASPAESAKQTTSVGGGGQSTWQPPDWAVEPRPGLYWLDVVKDGEVVDKVNLEKRRHIFGRQAIMCDFVLDHPSVSRQHAVVVQHKNGSVYVIDLGSVHGTFVANERLSKDNPVELEVGQSLRFAASTRIYVLKKGIPDVPQFSQPSVDTVLPPPPDPSNEEAVLAYNTVLNRLGVPRRDSALSGHMNEILSRNDVGDSNDTRPTKRPRKSKVTFRDQYDGVLVEVVGISDGADVSTEPGPLGVKEGSLVGRFDDLVEVIVIPKGKEGAKTAPNSNASTGVTQRLQQYLEKVKSPSKGGLYGDLYGDSFGVQVGASWAKNSSGDSEEACELVLQRANGNRNMEKEKAVGSSASMASDDDDDDDLFGNAGEKIMQPELFQNRR